MTLPYGNPLPPDFVDGNELAAAEFNAVKNYWVTDELPDTAEDGDVVFVIEGEPAGGGGELPGIGGWATIKEVSGDYEKHPDGDWVAYEFKDNGTITTSGGIVDALLVGGGSYRTSVPRFCGGRVNEGLLLIGESHTITVGKGQQTQSATWGSGSAISGVIEQGPVPYPATGNYADAGTAPNGGVISNITGSEVNYAAHSLGTPGGSTAVNNTAGLDGVVVIRVPAANAPNVQETFHSWNNYASVENGVVVETQKLPDNQPRTLSNEWVDAPAEVSVGWIYDGSEFVPPAPPSNKDLIAELEARVEELRKA